MKLNQKLIVLFSVCLFCFTLLLVWGTSAKTAQGAFNINAVMLRSSNMLTPLRQPLEHPNGWLYPAGSSSYQYLSWLCFNSAFNGYHLAQDMANPQGDPVYAIDSGDIIYSSDCVGGYGGPSGGTCGGAVVIQHRAKDGTWFTALYGHLDNPRPKGHVYFGDVIGYSNNWNPPHVHFGIRLGYGVADTNPYRGYTSSTSNLYGFTKPVNATNACGTGTGFLESYYACRNGSSVNFRPNNSAPIHPNGTLIKSSADTKVYLIRNGQKQGIASPEVLRNLYPNGGYDFKDVITIAQDELSSYPEVTPAITSQLPSNGKTHSEGRLIRRSTGGEISIVTDNGMRRPFVSLSVFLSLGYLLCNVADATDSNYDSYEEGSSVTGNDSITPPLAPAATAATNVASNSFTANWSGSSGAAGYRLDVSTSNSFNTYVSGYQNLDVGNVLSRNINGLSAGTTYYFRVRAYNTGGTSGNSNTISVTTTTTNIQVTVQTSPSGRAFSVDGVAYSSTQTFSWAPGSNHTISTTSPQSGGSGTQYMWSNWSDGGAISHTVAPGGTTTYTANFTTQYFLTMNASTGGTVSPTSGWFNSGQNVSITATPNSSYSFAGWAGTGSGSFTGTTNPTSVVMNGPITETANFSPQSFQLTVSKAGSGSGTVTGGSGAINCGGTCQAALNSGTQVTLTATPANGSTFTGWSGDCSGTGTCTLTMNSSKTVTATFQGPTPNYQLTVNKTGNGSGTVTSNTGAINCGGTCSASLSSSAQITLTATPASGSTFTGWGGDCSGTGTCTLTMNSNKNATAIFNATSSRIVRVENSSGSPSSTVSTPIVLEAQGGENLVAFSLTFDPGILTNPQVTLGSDASAASAQLISNVGQAAQGRVGAQVGLPAEQGLTAGTQQIVVVTFSIATNVSVSSTPISFGEQPIAKIVADTSLNDLTQSTTFNSGVITIAQGYEADVNPRPNGNKNINALDWAQVGRFAAGLEIPPSGSEFQRADCYPRNTLGDGKINALDWAQAGRYSAALDPIVSAGGPTSQSSLVQMVEIPSSITNFFLHAQQRMVRAVNSNGSPGGTVSIPIVLEAQGGENLIAFIDLRISN